jgi:uncharacterized protein (UPF0548 family)
VRVPKRVTRRIESLRDEQPSYPEVGGTRGRLPDGYHHMHAHRTIGTGATRFATAAAALDRWQVQRGAGVQVYSAGEPVSDGAVALLGRGPVALYAPVRVVYTITEERRRGFAYGTLAGHPVSGEEAFVLELLPDESVVLSITAFSRPASRLTRLAGPVGRAVQRYMVHRYLRALDG